MPFRAVSTNKLSNSSTNIDDEDPSSDFEDANDGTSSLKLNPIDPAKIDHRKKRRNRTTQSCLSCHQNKRKCDRGRPCGRCITLGLTGFCVYEVGEKTRDKDSDEVTSLRNRVAELEGVVRELKNKPQPRWAANAISSATNTNGNNGSGSGTGDQGSFSGSVPSTPAPMLSFPKESWHVRSARKDALAAMMDRENDGSGSGNGGNSDGKKKRKIGDVVEGNSYRVKMESANHPNTNSSFYTEDNGDDDSSTTVILGSPLLFPSSSSQSHPYGHSHSHSHGHSQSQSMAPVSPIRRQSVPGSSGRYGLIPVPMPPPNANPNPPSTSSRSVTDPLYNNNNNNSGTSTGHHLLFSDPPPHVRRSLTGPAPGISSLSRRTAVHDSSTPSPGTVSSNSTVNSTANATGAGGPGGPGGSGSRTMNKITGPPCACLADVTATQFVAHLSQNVRSTIKFLETRHRKEVGESGSGVERTDGDLDSDINADVDPLVKTMHDCGVMRSLSALEKAIKLSSGVLKRAYQQHHQPHQSHSQPNSSHASQQPGSVTAIQIPAPLTPPPHLRFFDDVDADQVDEDLNHNIDGGNGEQLDSSGIGVEDNSVNSGLGGSHDHGHGHLRPLTENDIHGHGQELDELEQQQAEMLDPPSPVDMLSEEALEALRDEHPHAHQAPPRGRPRLHSISSSDHGLGQVHGQGQGQGMVGWVDAQSQQQQQQHQLSQQQHQQQQQLHQHLAHAQQQQQQQQHPQQQHQGAPGAGGVGQEGAQPPPPFFGAYDHHHFDMFAQTDNGMMYTS